ncbi:MULTISPECIES: nucleoside deaminase [unclassified Novosphingobium]|uniref:nucleoside deaminase n=1 Tax=unclassified Novosphingobium TaxID=2644732 RepID=UPI0018516F38|nr:MULTISPECIES: nucleoside deaminase [unclassified Novosphingobium]NKJ43352.1 tRNA(adenine34) deaminase [Novosphingobium sp. SG720]NMN06954.1 tRNA(adenine34) deaminase [Novosphingobium sp. SG919]NMN89459.1 tRNA(adenine34) deaminase [Novosphingobium sp. SG916]
MNIAATDDAWMARAIALAIREKGDDPANTPIAALVVRAGKLVGAGVNRTAEHCDATAHAEVEALRAAGQEVGDMKVDGATLYTTLQPCGMCTMAAIWAGISRIVYGAGRSQVHAMYFEDRHLSTFDYIRDAFKDDLTLDGGVAAEACARLYYGPHDDVPEDQQANT